MDGKETRKNVNDSESKTEYTLVENLLNMPRTEETKETPNIINEEIFIVAPGKEKHQFRF